jgi:hypothetical protein
LIGAGGTTTLLRAPRVLAATGGVSATLVSKVSEDFFRGERERDRETDLEDGGAERMEESGSCLIDLAAEDFVGACKRDLDDSPYKGK